MSSNLMTRSGKADLSMRDSQGFGDVESRPGGKKLPSPYVAVGLTTGPTDERVTFRC